MESRYTSTTHWGKNRYRLISSELLPANKSAIRLEFKCDGVGPTKGGKVTLFVNDSGSPATGSPLRQNSHFPPLPIITDGQARVAGATAPLRRIDGPAKFFCEPKKSTRWPSWKNSARRWMSQEKTPKRIVFHDANLDERYYVVRAPIWSSLAGNIPEAVPLRHLLLPRCWDAADSGPARS
jgi:hypothetical protein